MDDWDKLLPYIQFTYNTSLNATTKCTPFELMYGRSARLPLDLIIPDIDLDLQLIPEQCASNLKATLEKALKIIQVNVRCPM
jgi:hypothetical protein